jgi:hypothetical protein
MLQRLHQILQKKRKREDTCVVDEEYGLGDAKECEENQSPFLSVAKSAMHEILRLLSNIDKSLWRNNINEEVGFILDQKRYMNLNSIFSKLISSDRREESSKAELIVRSSGKHLVELILDSVSNYITFLIIKHFNNFRIYFVKSIL